MTVLGVFFTRGVSLRSWINSGLFDREVLIYHAHLKSGFFSKIYWFTYGADDSNLEKELHKSGRLKHEINVIGCPRWLCFAGRVHSTLYSIIMPLVIMKTARQCDVFKTNQMDGSHAALFSAMILRKPLYVRTGYTLTRAVQKVSPKNWLRQLTACINERLAFTLASASSVSSNHDKKYILKKYGKKIGHRLEVVGNYVDTILFDSGDDSIKRLTKILYVGRLSPEKNLRSAILACAKVGVQLDIVGTGIEFAALKIVAQQCGAKVDWIGVVSNNELPKLFREYQFFILPSLWEGLPKALIEAMSAGLVCIGTDTTGINEIIKDGYTGFLAKKPDHECIAVAIQRALLCDWFSISKAGRQYVCENFSLEQVTSKEKKIFSRIINQKAPRAVEN